MPAQRDQMVFPIADGTLLFSMKKRVPKESWDENHARLVERGKDAYPNAREWNRVLDEFRLKVERIALVQLANDGSIDFEKIKDELFGTKKEKEKMKGLFLSLKLRHNLY